MELRVQFESCLKKLVFSMCLLQGNDVVILDQTLPMPFFSLRSEEEASPASPFVFDVESHEISVLVAC